MVTRGMRFEPWIPAPRQAPVLLREAPPRPADPPETMGHLPVLLPEVLAALRPAGGARYVDCTFGRGGHARALLDRLPPHAGMLVADRDPEAVAAARTLAGEDPRVRVAHATFSALEEAWKAAFGEAAADGVLFDLGVSSPQLEDPARGFSFRHDGPLDMRMDPAGGPSAAEWLEAASEAELAEVLRRLGEERRARRIAREIVAARGRAPVRRTRELAEVVARVVRRPGHGGSAGRARHPATGTFRALRMTVNREIEQLECGLAQAARLLRPGGRLAVISFHSLEDRTVKHFLRNHGAGPPAPRDLPIEARDLPRPLFVVHGRAVRPGEAEVRRNPRARSAVLRVGEKR